MWKKIPLFNGLLLFHLPFRQIIKPINYIFIDILYCAYENHTLTGVWVAAILVQSQKAEIFQVGKRNIQN
jgi:hypothetical protein